jgi:conserved oligomeric Golgi complex subunit 8
LRPSVFMDAVKVENVAEISFSKYGGNNLTPEDDARDALLSLRGYLLSGMERDSSEVCKWDEFDSCIEDLCSHGLETLSREPEMLAVEGVRLRDQLDDAACKNYRALIQSFECAGAVRDGVGKVRMHLDGLVDALPPLAEATREFSANAATVQAQREARLRTLAEYGQIFDILEMPRLMRSLVAGEMYDEALELHDLSIKLAAMNAGESIIMSACADVDALTRQMVVQLLALLRGSVQLPSCLRVVSFLRRLSIFSESRLRMIFLQCRGDWMRGALDTSTSPNAQAKLVRLSEDTRSMVFEIITQYRAAFGDDDSLCSSPGIHVDNSMEGYAGAVDVGVQAPAILFDWTATIVSQYLQRLEEGLCDIRDGASICTVLQQAMYCGQSLGRVGADFRPVLGPLFDDAVMRVINSHLSAALRQFEMMIEDHRWAPVGSSAMRKDRLRNAAIEQRTSSSLQNVEEPGSIDEHSTANNVKAFEPPMTVLDSPPLAVFLNGILAGLNELRSCSLLSLSAQLGQKLTETLLEAAECVITVGGPGGAFLKRADRPHFESLQASLRDLCVPHVARCLDHCMGQTKLIDVGAVLSAMCAMFGEPVLPRSTNTESQAPRLHGQHQETEMPPKPQQHQHASLSINGQSRARDAESSLRGYQGGDDIAGGDSSAPAALDSDFEDAVLRCEQTTGVHAAIAAMKHDERDDGEEIVGATGTGFVPEDADGDKCDEHGDSAIV